MNKEDRNRVCPVELSGSLDNKIRRFIQNPRKILKHYINDGMTVLDFGCGPGFFTIEIAKMLSPESKVIAADLQNGMLEKLAEKIKGTELENKIQLHKCEQDKIGITEKVDFILAFYVIHEVPDKEKLFGEFKTILKPDGKILIIEPNFHVSKNSFNEMLKNLEIIGFKIIEKPYRLLSRAVLIDRK
jgi:ubiquinone/menaquinone biosynthesis C-methylase UbiE